MKAAGANLIALLAATNEYAMADLYTFTLADLSTLKYTSAQYDVGAFSALGPELKRGTTRSVIGVGVDTLSVTMAVNSDVRVSNVPLAQFAMNGGFDGAHLTLERSFAANWSAPQAGTLTMFAGRVADVAIVGSAIDLSITSDLELLNVMMPRNLYQATCIHNLYDADCGVVAATYTVASAVAANSTTRSIYCNLAQADGYFGLGTLTFTSGPNNGTRRTVKRYVTGRVDIVPALLTAPGIGDTFSIKPGCDKLMATCNGKYTNLGNFRATPFIPNPETAY